MMETATIGGRFHGPPGSGNGGYCCGTLANFIEGPASVRLRIPPPLDEPMEVRRLDDGVGLFSHNDLVASGRPASIDIEVPDAPGFEAARAASARFRGFESHFYPGCFVCGPEREHGDGLRIFAGPAEPCKGPEGMVAATWIPDESLADSSGNVAPQFLWAALDCPGAYSFPEPETGTILLGELAVDIRGAVLPGEKCVVTGWQISHEGRKHFTGTALFGESGSCRAVGYATWFEVPTDRIGKSS
jgi:hypothetical protein